MATFENFKHLNGFEKNLKKELGAINPVSIKKGEIIVRQSSYIKSLPIVIDGQLRVYRHTEDREMLFYHIFAGGTCGMSLAACLEQKIINSEIMSTQNSMVVWIPQSKIFDWLRQYHSWNEFIIHTFSQRQNQMIQTFDDIAFNKMDKRIKDYLFDLYKIQNNPVISITHQELANELGTTRVVISRILKTLELDGIIELLRGAIKVKKMVRC